VRTLFLILKLILFLLLLGLAVKNSDFVSVRYFLGLEWQAPLSLVMLVAFGAGLVAGLAACGSRLLRIRRELRALRKSVRTE
jgi:putative membrane protein